MRDDDSVARVTLVEAMFREIDVQEQLSCPHGNITTIPFTLILGLFPSAVLPDPPLTRLRDAHLPPYPLSPLLAELLTTKHHATNSLECLPPTFRDRRTRCPTFKCTMPLGKARLILTNLERNQPLLNFALL